MYCNAQIGARLSVILRNRNCPGTRLVPPVGLLYAGGK